MKILTLNCHSWLEENKEVKFQQLVDKIIEEDFDVIALQEVNQTQGEEAGILDEWYCFNNDTWPILRDNFALALSEALLVEDKEYYWTWGFSHLSYGRFEEGLALFSKEPLLATVTQVSECSDTADARRRILVSGVTETNGELVTVGSIHHSWWANDAFKIEWQGMEKALMDNQNPLILAGDFNQIAGTVGHELVLNSPLKLKDSFEIAETTVGEATIEGPIDGWNDHEGSLRIDYVFVSEGIQVKNHTVTFDGVHAPLVSDHYGIMVELELIKASV
ncbi:endonuclease/exonuclease/phosphatase family protein [Enterococcus eurekensis]|uniref:Endonuclease/exonuclease/phosphatase family protein n=1 Tax=Enterococcus eurekensis TaxID=1159753 RepID=A0ABV9M6M7_9ENTE